MSPAACLGMQLPARLLRRAVAAAVVLVALPAAAQDLSTIWQAVQANDPQLQVARAALGVGKSFAAQADALWHPRVSLSADLGVARQDSEVTGARFSAPTLGQVSDARFATTAGAGPLTRVALVAQQPLIQPGRSAQQAQLLTAAAISELAWHGARADLMLRTAERYFSLALAVHRQRVVQQQLLAVERTVAMTRERYRTGAAPITDTHEADAAAAGLRAQLAAADLEAARLGRSLQDSSGLPNVVASLPLRALTRADLTSLDGWIQKATTSNLQLRQLQMEIQLAQQRLQEAHTSQSPTVDLVAQALVDRVGSGLTSTGAGLSRQGQLAVTLRLQLPLYSGGMDAARAQEAIEQLNRTRAEFDAAQVAVRQQVEMLWLARQVAQARVAALQQSLLAQDARLQATRLGQSVGDRTTQEVLNAQADHALAALTLAHARVDQVLTDLRLAAQADELDAAWLQKADAALKP